MREKDGYREQLARIAEVYPNRVALNVQEAAQILGVDRRTVVKLIQSKKLVATNISSGTNKRYIIPVTALARIAAG
jgi:excisionase family DNA binding protein